MLKEENTMQEDEKLVFEEDFGEAHNASADVEATARCFLELIRLNLLDWTPK